MFVFKFHRWSGPAHFPPLAQLLDDTVLNSEDHFSFSSMTFIDVDPVRLFSTHVWVKSDGR